MIENRKGLSYISVLAVFLLLAFTSWNLFFCLKNYNLQSQMIKEKREIFYKCQQLANEAIFFPQANRNIHAEGVLYQISRSQEGTLVKARVLASRDGNLLEEGNKSKFFLAEEESLNEEDL